MGIKKQLWSALFATGVQETVNSYEQRLPRSISLWQITFLPSSGILRLQVPGHAEIVAKEKILEGFFAGGRGAGLLANVSIPPHGEL